jgi:hypothetical protein
MSPESESADEDDVFLEQNSIYIFIFIFIHFIYMHARKRQKIRFLLFGVFCLFGFSLVTVRLG